MHMIQTLMTINDYVYLISMVFDALVTVCITANNINKHRHYMIYTRRHLMWSSTRLNTGSIFSLHK